MTEAKREAANMGRLAAGMFLLLLILAGAIFGLVFLGNEASKENHTTNSVITDLDGNPTQTKPLEAFSGLSSVPLLPTSILNTMTYLTFTGTYSNQAEVFYVAVQSWKRSEQGGGASKVTVRAADGELVLVTSGVMTFQTYDRQGNRGLLYTVTDAPASRRLTAHHHASEGIVRLYSSIAHLQDAAVEHHARYTSDRRNRRLLEPVCSGHDGADETGCTRRGCSHCESKNGARFCVNEPTAVAWSKHLGFVCTASATQGRYPGDAPPAVVSFKAASSDVPAASSATTTTTNGGDSVWTPINDPSLVVTDTVVVSVSMQGYSADDLAPSSSSFASASASQSAASAFELSLLRLLGQQSGFTAHLTGVTPDASGGDVSVDFVVGASSKSGSDLALQKLAELKAGDLEAAFRSELLWNNIQPSPSLRRFATERSGTGTPLVVPPGGTSNGQPARQPHTVVPAIIEPSPRSADIQRNS